MKKKTKEFMLCNIALIVKLPDSFIQPYGLYVYYVVHFCDFGVLKS